MLVPRVADVLRHHVGGGLRVILRAANLRLLLAFVPHVHAVLVPDILLRLRDFQDDIIHRFDGVIYTVLRDELLRMDGGHTDRPVPSIRLFRVVPLDEEEAAALNRHGALRHVVHFLEVQAVKLVSQHILDHDRKPFVLRVHRRDLRRRDVRVDLRLDQLRHDVVHMGRPRVLRVLAGVGFENLVRSAIKRLAVIHGVQLLGIGKLILGKPLFPQIKFFSVFLLHAHSPNQNGLPQRLISIRRSASPAFW